MPAANRSQARDVHVYDPKDLSKPLGGLVITPGITNANLYTWIPIICMLTTPYILQLDDGSTIIPKDNNALRPGSYHVITTEPILINDEPFLTRTISNSSGTRAAAFRDAVCFFQAAHVFPLAHEGRWIEKNYGRWITKPSASGGTINSVQNGLLLRRDIHGLFDSYEVSINPDDDYNIVFFIPDGDNIAGRHLDRRFLDDPDRAVDAVLRWHFRQAVLANVRGAGEPIFEHDFPPGLDMIGEIVHGPKARERMEFESFSRLGPVQDL